MINLSFSLSLPPLSLSLGVLVDNYGILPAEMPDMLVHISISFLKTYDMLRNITALFPLIKHRIVYDIFFKDEASDVFIYQKHELLTY